ncbi:helix-turn-helix domain-containing protein [Pseudomonas fluorescens]|uniref:helix-turn-helix domain-containing protein n=1 Tax=Pseudomonas fluorescens TaxID=294 RepID=UPI0017825033|nr:helix-turn-helix domain-containing protein [Pseudomonas fluorescens]MBD8235842.1 helix-turn-helix domain-containing protein [Pseudomonas fluorescens]MDY0894942.1 helix-turn-helix domain-containing protein [Pseudomonas fluorescens]
MAQILPKISEVGVRLYRTPDIRPLVLQYMEAIMVNCIKNEILPADRKPFIFDTLSVGNDLAFEYWSEAVSAHFSPTQNTTASSRSCFQGRMEIFPLGILNVSHLHTSVMRNVRDLWSLRNIPNDDFFVMAINAGVGGQLSQLGRQLFLGPGDLMVYDSAREFSFEYLGETDLYIAQVPRRLLDARIKDPQSIIARAITHTNPLASMLLTMIKSFTQLDQSSKVESRNALSKSFVDILVSSLECSLDFTDLSNTHCNLLERAKKIVNINLDDPDFHVGQLAQTLGASSRTLCRIFAAEGTTVTKYLWQNRLLMAHNLITEGHIKQVGQIALQCGFSDFSHFSRAFKKEFNASPKQLLSSHST